MATKTELLATVTMLSLDPERPITDDTAAQTRSVAAQAALAIDNARLYQQQKEFAETMQRTLVPQAEPQLDGFELGHVYESSAEVEVGGDVYDFLHLDDGRLAVVLGDVTGHGVDAAADMAMAKFIFRTLAREYPEPAGFLTRANEVLVGEIELGRFITMTHLVFDPKRGEVVSASAGHPAPRLVTTDGTIVPLGTSGLALGVEAGQAYEETRTTVEPGASVVVYTDGVVESRRETTSTAPSGSTGCSPRAGRAGRASSPRPSSPTAEPSAAACRPTTSPWSSSSGPPDGRRHRGSTPGARRRPGRRSRSAASCSRQGSGRWRPRSRPRGCWPRTTAPRRSCGRT